MVSYSVRGDFDPSLSKGVALASVGDCREANLNFSEQMRFVGIRVL